MKYPHAIAANLIENLKSLRTQKPPLRGGLEGLKTKDMKLKTYLTIIVFFIATMSHGQTFLTKGVIEFEVKQNIKKGMGNGVWAEMMKENLETFKTGYYTFTFANNKSIYQFDHWEEKTKLPAYLTKSDEENTWYHDYDAGKFNMQKNIAGSNFNIEDSIQDLHWKLTNESRVIAGFNCRKAVAVIYDSVYVFAFYTDEIMISGGPCIIHGLPGMILGVTIPRLFTSWIATKLTVSVDESIIKPSKAKKTMTAKNFQSFLNDKMKEWSTDDDDEKQQKNRFFWSMFLHSSL